jgi:hypothetical protein
MQFCITTNNAGTQLGCHRKIIRMTMCMATPMHIKILRLHVRFCLLKLDMQVEQCNYVPVGKTMFITYTKLITREDIVNGLDRYYWNIPSVRSYTKKSQYMYEPIKRLEKQIEISIPQWEDSRNIFQRIKVKCIADVLVDENCKLWDTHDKLTWLPSVEIINLIKSTE